MKRNRPQTQPCTVAQPGSAERILARKVARELTAQELAEIAGGRLSRAGVTHSGPCCEEDDCGT